MIKFFANLLDEVMLNIQFLSIRLDFKEEYLPGYLLVEVPQYQLLICYHLLIFIVILEGLKVILNLHVYLI